jgi:hypothetical protein
MSIYDKFSTDQNLESGDGVTIDYGDFKITIHRAGGANKAYLKTLNEKIKPYRRMMEAGNMNEDVSRKMLVETYAETIIKGWEGITDEKGKKLAFTKENVIKVMTDLPELFNMIVAEADRVANFKKEALEADAKNSVKS